MVGDKGRRSIKERFEGKGERFGWDVKKLVMLVILRSLSLRGAEVVCGFGIGWGEYRASMFEAGDQDPD